LYDAYEQEDNQTRTEFLQSVEEKVSELRKLGLIYANFEIGNKVYEGLLPNTNLFVFTNLMSLQIPCDLQYNSKILIPHDETMTSRRKSTDRTFGIGSERLFQVAKCLRGKNRKRVQTM